MVYKKTSLLISKLGEKMYKKSVITTKTNLNLLQIKIWSWMFYKAFYYHWAKNNFTVSLKELKEAVDYKGEDEHFRKTVLSLMNCLINFYTYEDNETILETACILSYCQINDDLVTYHYNQLIESKITSKQMYKKLLMLIQNQFHSKYSRIIYGSCLNNFNVNTGFGEHVVYLEQLRRYLELEEHEYPLFREINRTIIKKALEEINDKSNLNIRVEYIKYGKSIIAIKFITNLNPGNLLPFPESASQTFEQAKEQILNNKELKDFFSKNKISIKLIEKKVNFVIDSGISAEFIAEYLIFIKNFYYDKKNIIGNDTFIDNLSQNKNIEKFLQKIAGEQMKKQEKHDEELQKLYKAQELVKVLNFFKENNNLFNQLIEKNKEKPVIKVLKKELFSHELINSIAIAEILLPQLKKLDEYKHISYEVWKEENLKVFF